MSVTFFPSSPASDQAPEPKPRVTVGKLPFDELPLRQSFSVPLDGANVRALRAQVARRSKDGKRFVLVIHKEHNVIEIARKEPLPVAVPVSAPVVTRPWSSNQTLDAIGIAATPVRLHAPTQGDATITEEQRSAIFGAPPTTERTVGASPAFSMPFGGGSANSEVQQQPAAAYTPGPSWGTSPTPTASWGPAQADDSIED